ncbi:MAG: hypothetical protein WCO51_11430 [bacterium]
MTSNNKTSKILWFESIGFLLIVVLSVLNELMALPARLFGGVVQSDWRQAVLEVAMAGVVWFVVYKYTKRLLTRLYRVESYIRLCAWCRHIHHNDEWLPLEEYFAKGYDTETTHGICPTCAEECASQLNESP